MSSLSVEAFDEVLDARQRVEASGRIALVHIALAFKRRCFVPASSPARC